MTKFFSKIIFIAFVLFFGILFGIYQASQGMMSGTPTSNAEVEITEVEITEHSSKDSSKSNERHSHDEQTKRDDDTNIQAVAHLKDKQQRLAEIDSHNFFSELGSNLAELLKVTVVAILTVVTSTINDLLN
ncbi:DUF3679 domain-containing protein [Desertibacillus haloalkaliphilus]|uniref:DUF3679 domain-containing protein n=1 Tax=Desertibacillus haloalkaliphilus TaxID=1328930 RepID=UPI001C27D9F9|nr:DUF3679 domain-containing protein [Desertibacillus haloalkaliphilus]MBU8905627.1 YqxA family protein [Desertibacillus haloalkaliphilus]